MDKYYFANLIHYLFFFSILFVQRYNAYEI